MRVLKVMDKPKKNIVPIPGKPNVCNRGGLIGTRSHCSFIFLDKIAMSHLT